jgi:hypothetical protein
MGGAFGPVLLLGSVLLLIAFGVPITYAIAVAALLAAWWVRISGPHPAARRGM